MGEWLVTKAQHDEELRAAKEAAWLEGWWACWKHVDKADCPYRKEQSDE